MVGELSKGPDVGNWSLANQHLLNTVRILVRRKDGSHSVGTGFMHRFCETGDEAIQCVVTNRHVISESVSCELVFRSRKVDAVDAPVVASTIRFEEGFEERWFKHPDERVDLAVLPVSNEFRQMLGNGFTLLTAEQRCPTRGPPPAARRARRPARGSLLWATGTSYRRSPWRNFTPPSRYIFSPPLTGGEFPRAGTIFSVPPGSHGAFVITDGSAAHVRAMGGAT